MGSLPASFQIRDGRAGLLRPLEIVDAEEVVTMLPRTHAESDFLGFMAGEFKLTVEEEREWIRKRVEGGQVATIAAIVDGRIVGLAGCERSPFRRHAHQAEMGVTVLKEYWGLGVGKALSRAVLDWGRSAGLHLMRLRVFDANTRAIALYRSLGFEEEARLHDDALRADGGLHNTIIMTFRYRQ